MFLQQERKTIKRPNGSEKYIFLCSYMIGLQIIITDVASIHRAVPYSTARGRLFARFRSNVPKQQHRNIEQKAIHNNTNLNPKITQKDVLETF